MNQSQNVAQNITLRYFISTAMWATSIPASGMIHPTYETFIWEWKDFGDKKEGSVMGDMHDIIIIKYYPPQLPERFEAILSSPLHYISRMIEDGFVGVVVKATTTTDKFMHDIFVEMTKDSESLIEDYEKEMKNARKV